MKQEIIEYVKLQYNIKNENYDELLSNYFDLGELYIQKVIGSKRLTSTLYLVLKEYVLYKFEKDYNNLLGLSSDEMINLYLEKPELEEFFKKYKPLFINYKSLCKAEMWLRL